MNKGTSSVSSRSKILATLALVTGFVLVLVFSRNDSRGRITSESPGKWHERDGVIYFTVTSNGTTGEQWIERFEKRGYEVDDQAKKILSSSYFKPTNGVTTEIAVLKGTLFDKDNCTYKKIGEYAAKHTFAPLNVEAVCLIHEAFSLEEVKAMGLWSIIVMHKPVEMQTGFPLLLNLRTEYSDENAGYVSSLFSFLARPDMKFRLVDATDGTPPFGFAFAVPPEVSTR